MTGPGDGTDGVRTARRGTALVVTLDNPTTRNAIDGATARRLLAIVAAAEADPRAGRSGAHPHRTGLLQRHPPALLGRPGRAASRTLAAAATERAQAASHGDGDGEAQPGR